MTNRRECVRLPVAPGDPGRRRCARQLIDSSVRGLGPGYYTPSEIEAGLRHVFGVDTQLVSDGTYYLIEHDGVPVACGGWSGRRTLFGGDQHKSGVDDRLDPSLDPARIRAFFVHPRHARRGLGRRLYEGARLPRVRRLPHAGTHGDVARRTALRGPRLRVARTRSGAHAVGATAVHQDDSINRRRVGNALSTARHAKTSRAPRANTSRIMTPERARHWERTAGRLRLDQRAGRRTSAPAGHGGRHATLSLESPQLRDRLFLTDGGMETYLISQGLQLPDFASFHLLEKPDGEEAMRAYFRTYAAIARRYGTGLILETPPGAPTPTGARATGSAPRRWHASTARAVSLLEGLRDGVRAAPVVISGCIGPRGDGYVPDAMMTRARPRLPPAADRRPSPRPRPTWSCAITMNYVEEAIGIRTRRAKPACRSRSRSRSRPTAGCRPANRSAEAIAGRRRRHERLSRLLHDQLRAPDPFRATCWSGGAWMRRIRGMRANASCRSHAELDEATELDAGDPPSSARTTWNCGAAAAAARGRRLLRHRPPPRRGDRRGLRRRSLRVPSGVSPAPPPLDLLPPPWPWPPLPPPSPPRVAVRGARSPALLRWPRPCDLRSSSG